MFFDKKTFLELVVQKLSKKGVSRVEATKAVDVFFDVLFKMLKDDEWKFLFIDENCFVVKRKGDRMEISLGNIGIA